ncbi:MAG: hypothetical protein HUJ96_04555 [Marinilabiliaceae bacterium]|nr:hypothetical protein [Marinilabiliaceae bacterium]
MIQDKVLKKIERVGLISAMVLSYLFALTQLGIVIYRWEIYTVGQILCHLAFGGCIAVLGAIIQDDLKAEQH